MTASNHADSTELVQSESGWEPTNTPEAAEAIRQAGARGQQLYFGHCPSALSDAKTAVRLSVRHMNQVVDYPARDMTITVQAGMSVGTLQQILCQEGQQLPIDAGSPQQTIGSLVASNTSGPRRFGYGTLRDYVIGIEAVDGRGRVFEAGGRVVKNVAGYDLCRLMVGSAGQLALLTQITFKLKPLPETSRLLVFGFNRLSDVEASLDRLNLSAARPVSLEIMNRSAANAILLKTVFDLQLPEPAVDCNYFLTSGVEGTPAVCEWQVEILQSELQSTAGWKWIEPASNDKTHISEDVDQRIMTLQTDLDDAEWLARLTTLPSRAVSSISMLEPHACLIFGRAGNGVLYFRRGRKPANDKVSTAVCRDEHTDPGLPESTAIASLNHIVSDEIGALCVLKSKESRTVSLPAQTMQLSRALCRTFDPLQIFSSHSS